MLVSISLLMTKGIIYFNSYYKGVGSNPAPIRVDSAGGGDLP